VAEDVTAQEFRSAALFHLAFLKKIRMVRRFLRDGP